jgi:predicted CoA-binding protein
MNTSLDTVQDFVSQRSLAVVGASRGGKKFGNTIYKTLKEKGYKVFPVHPGAETIEGDVCYRSLTTLPEKVAGVVVCVKPDQCEHVVKEAFEAGIARVWLQQGASSYAALRYCEKNEMSVVHGHCLLMFLEPVKSFHRVHRWFWKTIGKYPTAHSGTHVNADARG